MHIEDRKTAALSKMVNRKVICNGEVNGYKCIHYFSFAAKTDAQNKEFLNTGEKFRNCTVCPGYLIEFDGEESLPHTCDRYEGDYPAFVKGLVALKRFFFADRKFDPSFEEYNPETQEDVHELTKIAHGGVMPNLGMNKEQNLSGGVPGATAPMTESQLIESIKKMAIVNHPDENTRKSVDQVLEEMYESGYEVSPEPEDQKPQSFEGETQSGARVTVKGVTKKTSTKVEDSDSGIFGDSND